MKDLQFSTISVWWSFGSPKRSSRRQVYLDALQTLFDENKATLRPSGRFSRQAEAGFPKAQLKIL